MAKCSRCGTTFNYQKREGVCPKCCFYNRPEGTVVVDNAWTKKYGIDDSSYQLPKMENTNDFDENKIPGLFGRLKKDKNGDCEQEGSHVHRTFDVHGYDGRATGSAKKPAKKAPMTPAKIFMIIIGIYMLINVLVGIAGILFF